MPNREPSAHSRFFSAVLLILFLGVPLTTAQAQETLDIYLIDVEGGGATLFVSPAGESLLVDTGNGGQSAARDARRIMDAMQDAGVTEIDHLITTHWHGDHYGAMQELASQVPVRHFIDHGPSVESSARVAEFLSTTYRELHQAAEHTVVTPGDRIALTGIDITVLASANTEFELMCPNNPIGRPTAARRRTQSTAPIRPAERRQRLPSCIFDGAPPLGRVHTDEPVPELDHQVSGHSDGSFTVTNGRNGFTKEYH